MILRELFVRLGLDVDAASFAEGESVVEIAKAGLSEIFDAANAVSTVFTDQVDAIGGWEYDLSKAADNTVKNFEKAIGEAKSLTDFLRDALGLLWAKVLQFILPVIQTITDYVRANVKFYGEQFSKLADYIKKNWDTIKVVLLAGAAAITVAMIALHWASVKAAIASAAAWLAAAWPFILIGTLIAGILLALDDIRVYLEGGDSMLGRWMKKWRALVDQYSKAPADKRPWWYTILVAITKEGAIEGWIKSVKGWLFDLWTSIKGIDWSPFTAVFTWLKDQIGDVDWKKWGLTIKAVLLTIGDEVKRIDFKSWALKIQGFLLKLEYAYVVAKNLVAMIGRGIEALGNLGRSVGAAGDWAKGIFRRKHPGERGEEQPVEGEPRTEGARPPLARRRERQEPGSGVLLPQAQPLPEWFYEPTAPQLFAGPLAAQPAPAPVVRQEITTRNEWNITQLPGESGEEFAQRVASIYDEKQQARNEAAAASLPATE